MTLTKSTNSEAQNDYEKSKSDLEFFNENIFLLIEYCKSLDNEIEECINFEILRLSAKRYYIKCIDKGKDRQTSLICTCTKMLSLLIEEIKEYTFFNQSIEDMIDEINVIFCNQIKNETEVRF